MTVETSEVLHSEDVTNKASYSANRSAARSVPCRPRQAETFGFAEQMNNAMYKVFRSRRAVSGSDSLCALIERGLLIAHITGGALIWSPEPCRFEYVNTSGERCPAGSCRPRQVDAAFPIEMHVSMIYNSLG